MNTLRHRLQTLERQAARLRSETTAAFVRELTDVQLDELEEAVTRLYAQKADHGEFNAQACELLRRWDGEGNV